ncbi:MAG TPA: type IV toxin-antitoxin system AbiEi family antitoxin [Terracidiphilus sp.]|nr:type IV toxin-antitoxin system AbiEi family antitoxin [Terracidiphilus sp.]
MEPPIRSLSPQESRVVLALTEQRQRTVTRAEIVSLLGGSVKAADHVIEALRRKGWLERATWGEYLLIPAEQGPDILGDSNLLARASRIADPYYIGYGTAAAHYGLTTQHRNVILLVTPIRLRPRAAGDSRVQIVNPAPNKFFGFGPVDVLGFTILLSDREKTAIDCIDRPDLAGGVGETASILATASRRLDWPKALTYLERMGTETIARRFGWLVDHVHADVPQDIRQGVMNLTGQSSTATLGPPRSRKVHDAIGYDSTWRLFVNVAKDELRDSAGLGRSKTIRRDT